jgi:hypothetical protein
VPEDDDPPLLSAGPVVPVMPGPVVSAVVVPAAVVPAPSLLPLLSTGSGMVVSVISPLVEASPVVVLPPSPEPVPPHAAVTSNTATHAFAPLV